MAHGLDYAQVDLFTYDYGPTKMAWVGKDVSCRVLRLCNPPLEWRTAPALPAQGPSFDCTRAATAQERLICQDPELSGMDRKMYTLYRSALGATSPTARAAQREWLAHSRNVCQDKACLTESYKMRTSQLSNPPASSTAR
ncbi:uncharacterized protein OKW28_007311 [Paraburkholderia sp. 40]